MPNYLDPTYRAQQQAAMEGMNTQPTNAAGPNFLDQLGAFAGGAIEGIPIAGPYLENAAHHVGAAISAGTGGNFGDELRLNREDDANLEQAYPGLNLGGNITGAVLGMAPFMWAAGAAGVPALAGMGPAGAGTRAIGGAVGGTALGAGDVAIRSGGGNPFEANPGDVGIGAGLGAVGGAVAPYLGAAVSRGVAGLANRFRTGAAAREAGIPSNVARPLTRAAQADNLGGHSVTQRLADLGPEGMLMDAGPNLRAQGAQLAASGGEAAEAVQQPLWTRQGNAAARLGQATTQALGQPQDVVAIFTALDNAAMQNSQPLYTAAYSQMLPPVAQLAETRRALQSRVGQEAWSRAARLAEAEGFAIYADAPTVRAIDLWQRELRAMAQEADASARTTGTNAARVYGGMRDRILAEIDTLVPDFADARAAYAGPKAMADAMEAGLDAFNTNMTFPQLQAAVNALSPSEQQAFAVGARSALSENLASAGQNRIQADSFFRLPMNVEKLRFLIGDQPTLDLVRTFGAEPSFALTEQRAQAAVGSAARTAARNEINPRPTQSNAQNITTLGAALHPIARAGNFAANSARSMTAEAQRAELARIHTLPPGPERNRVVDALLNNAISTPGGYEQLNTVIQALMLGGPTQGAQALAQ